MVGTRAFYGCDIVEICSIVVNDYVTVKMLHPNDNGKTETVHISLIDFN